MRELVGIRLRLVDGQITEQQPIASYILARNGDMIKIPDVSIVRQYPL